MQTISEPTEETSIVIGAPATRVWEIVADVTRTPEWSPACHAVEWIDGSSTAALGARFRGHNRLNGLRWTRDCVITELEPAAVLSYSTLFKGQESTRWRYRFEPDGESTTVREAYEIVAMPRWVRTVRSLPGMLAKSERDTAANLSTSLERLKAIAEAAG